MSLQDLLVVWFYCGARRLRGVAKLGERVVWACWCFLIPGTWRLCCECGLSVEQYEKLTHKKESFEGTGAVVVYAFFSSPFYFLGMGVSTFSGVVRKRVDAWRVCVCVSVGPP